MKIEQFKQKLKNKGVAILKKYDGRLDDFRALKGLIQYLDFDCQVNDTGGCQKNPSSKSCCCYDCLGNVGYFKLMLYKDILYYSKKFSVKTGFWRKEKGCILPHRMRSITCLTHHCNHGKRKDFGTGMAIIKQTFNDMRTNMIQNP